MRYNKNIQQYMCVMGFMYFLFELNIDRYYFMKFLKEIIWFNN